MLGATWKNVAKVCDSFVKPSEKSGMQKLKGIFRLAGEEGAT